MNFRKVRGTRLYEGVVDQIFEMIASGQLEPGHQLPPERHLAEQLGVSRNVLREAFRALEHRGIIISVQGGGRFIRADNIQGSVDTRGLILRLERATVREILESRELVETQAAMLAAERVDSEGETRLRAAAARTETWEDNRDFHVTLASLTGNFMLPKLVQIHLDLLADLNQRRHYQTAEQAKLLLLEHGPIADAVIARDPRRAGELMHRHFRNTRQFMRID